MTAYTIGQRAAKTVNPERLLRCIFVRFDEFPRLDNIIKVCANSILRLPEVPTTFTYILEVPCQRKVPT
jgi:hypothetical protein